MSFAQTHTPENKDFNKLMRFGSGKSSAKYGALNAAPKMKEVVVKSASIGNGKTTVKIDANDKRNSEPQKIYDALRKDPKKKDFIPKLDAKNNDKLHNVAGAEITARGNVKLNNTTNAAVIGTSVEATRNMDRVTMVNAASIRGGNLHLNVQSQQAQQVKGHDVKASGFQLTGNTTLTGNSVANQPNPFQASVMRKKREQLMNYAA